MASFRKGDLVSNFHDMELDDRLLKAIAKQGWSEPTLIQERAIPLILQGKDVLIRARTGSGKTGAFAVPIIQRILNSKQTASEQSTKVLILVPSKELCQQITKIFNELTVKCSQDVRVLDISRKVDVNMQRPLLTNKPDIVVSTPSQALVHLQEKSMHLKECLEMLVIDEADLMFSHGYESDMRGVLSFLPCIYQAVLASATLSDDVLTLKKLVLHNAVVLKLEEPALPPASQLQHYHLNAEGNDKAAILCALIKLHLVRGKSIIFVNSVDQCFRLKLFLEQFAVPSVVLNSELPATSRCHAVNQFNQGIYDIIIASDESALDQPEEPQQSRQKKRKLDVAETSKRKKDKESGVSRGIDFQFVSNVINFDFPKSINSYIHRVGRTARGNNKGTALSFVSVREQPLFNQVVEHLRSDHASEDNILKSFQFKLEEVEAFRYRANDAWRAVTKVAIREARLKEIRREILNSETLKSYFQDNPRDISSLRHDKALHTVKRQPHLAHVPEYIVPQALKKLALSGKNKKRHSFFKGNLSGSHFKARQNNPLHSMDFIRFAAKKSK